MSLDKATALHKQGRFHLAEPEYLKALAQDFDNFNILYALATLYFQTGKHGLAAILYKQTIMFKKDHFEAWNNLGNCYKSINKDEESEMCWRKCLDIKGKTDADYADIYNNLATLYVNLGTPEKGLEFVNKALEATPGHPDANWNKALLTLESGKYGEGFDLYKWGFNTKHRNDRSFGGNIPYWDGSPGKRVVVWGEQGIGDEILFASMMPDLINISKSIVFECHPRMVKLFENSFGCEKLHIYGTRKDAFVAWPHKHPEIDARVSIGDLGKWFRRDLSMFPKRSGYLKAIDDRVEYYTNRLDKISDRPKIGISWIGGYQKTRKDFRSIPLEKWKPVLECDADFISLQYTPNAYDEISIVEDKFDVRIHHWPSAIQCEDYHETAALVSALDLVITVNTAVHHLTGALGKPGWTLTPKGKAWRYYTPDGEHFPWYPSMRCIEQPLIGEWDPMLERTAHELKETLERSKVSVY